MGTTCPVCGSSDIVATTEGAGECRACGAALTVEGASACPACGSILPALAERCPRCGSPVGLADRVVAQRAGAASPLWLERTRAEAADLRSTGEQTSRERMDAFTRMDRHREEAILRQETDRHSTDRRLLGVTALAILAIVLLALALALAR